VRQSTEGEGRLWALAKIESRVLTKDGVKMSGRGLRRHGQEYLPGYPRCRKLKTTRSFGAKILFIFIAGEGKVRERVKEVLRFK